jgi:hypothetical protein
MTACVMPGWRPTVSASTPAWGHDHLLNQNGLELPIEEGWTILAALLGALVQDFAADCW